MNPWLTALDGLATVTAVLGIVCLFAWPRNGPARSACPARVVRLPAATPVSEMPEPVVPAIPFDSAVMVDPHGASRVPVQKDIQL